MINNQYKKVMLLSSVGLLMLPLAVSGDTGLGESGFSIKAINIEHGNSATRGIMFDSGSNGGSGGGNPPELEVGVIELMIGREDGAGGYTTTGLPASCTIANQAVVIEGLGSDGVTLISPGGNESQAVEGINLIAEPGVWRIEGEFDSFGRFNGSDLRCLTSVLDWENTGTTDLSYAFVNAINLTHIEEIPEGATNMSYMLSGAARFNEDVNDWDMSEVINSNSMFLGASSFNNGSAAGVANNPLDNWETSNLNDMGSMFERAAAFNQNVNSWDTSNAQTMRYVFKEASLFNQPLNNWDMSNAVFLSGMFEKATVFNQDLNSWTLGNAAEFNLLFSEARAFNNGSAPAMSDNPLTWQAENVLAVNRMFFTATSFNQPIDNLYMPSLTHIGAMFQYATAFNQNVNNLYLRQVEDTQDMFAGATAFNNGSPAGVTDLPLQWDTSSLLYASSMFAGATAFNQSLASWDVSRLVEGDVMFNGASSFNQDLSHWSLCNITVYGEWSGGSAMTPEQQPTFVCGP